MAITVFFDKDATDKQIKEIGKKLEARDEVSDVQYVSADDAWKSFQKDYFKDNETLVMDLKMTIRWQAAPTIRCLCKDVEI